MRFGIGLALLAAVALSSGARAAVVEEFKAEDWDGLAFTSDETGQFTHCSVYASYRNGSTLYISYEASDNWFFSVANDSWKLTEGGSFAIKFKVDRRGQVEGTGTALGPTQIGLPVERDHPFVGELRRGNELIISFQNKDYAFELSNSNRAMNAAQDCVRRHVALGTHTPIMSRKPGEQPAAQESEQAAQPPAEQSAQPDTNTADNSGSGSADTSLTPAKPSGDEQIFGPWSVTATGDEKGKFVNCTAYDVQGDDQLILSLFPDNIWTFGLYRTAWKLDTNQTYYLWYAIDAPADSASAIKRPVEAGAENRIFFEVSDVEDIIDKIEKGTTLNIRFRGVTGPAESYSYSLDQVHTAFEATRKCLSDHASSGAQAETPAGQSETVSKEGGAKGQAEANGSEPEAGPAAGPAEGGNTPQAPLPELGENKLEDIQVSGWEAGAYGKPDGTFTHCSINAEYQNGATLGFALTGEGEMVLVVKHGDWSLSPNAWVPISYTLKSGTPYSSSGQAQAVDTNVVMTDIGGVEDLGDPLKSANEVDVQVEGKDLSFDTSDIGPAFDAINQCAARHAGEPAPAAAPAAKKAPAGKVNPDAASAAPAAEEPASPPLALGATPAESQVASTGNAATEDDAALHTEAAGYTTALLIRSGYPNHIIVNGDDVPEAFRSHRAMWKLGDLVGLTDMVSGTTDEIMSRVFDSDKKDCAGEFTKALDSMSAKYEHIHTICKKSDGSLITVHYLVIPRDAGGSYMLSIIDTGDGTSVEAIAGKVYSTAAPM